jgi:hypothetical protein
MMYFADPWADPTAEDLMVGYGSANAEREWAELLRNEAKHRYRYYLAQGVDEAEAQQRSGYELAERRAEKARREVEGWWEQIRPKVLISDGGSL